MRSLRGFGSSAASLLALRALLAATALVLAALLAVVVLHAAYPSPSFLVPATLLGLALGCLSVATLGFAVVFAYARFPSYRKPILFLTIITVATLSAHLYIISNPALPDCRDSSKNVNGCIMDESYYVPTAENMLNGTQCGPSVPNCNMEHPFLSKALMAAGIAIFGDDAFGWRIFNVALGTFNIPLLFALALRLSRDRRIAYISSALLALDVMFFSQSSAGLIDIPSVFFGLLAFVAYVYELRVWVLNRYLISGAFMGLAILSKETGVFLALTLVTYHLLTHREGEHQAEQAAAAPARLREQRDALVVVRLCGGALLVCLSALAIMMTGAAPGFTVSSPWFRPLEYAAAGLGVPFVLAEAFLVLQEHPGLRPAAVSGLEMTLMSAAVFVLGMQAYDSLFASSAFPTFIDQLRYMLSYGLSLIGPGWTFGNNIQITPFSWMTYYRPVTYYGTSVSVCTNLVNGTCQGAPYVYPGVAYYGVTNLIETWTTYVWFPLAALVVWKAYRPLREGLERFGFIDPSRWSLTGEQKVAILSLVWFSWNYFPYIALFAMGRVTYPFYFVPALPAVAMGGSYFLTRSWVPKYAVALYLAGAFAFFFLYFPSKAFLPDWLRVLIGR